MNNQLFLVQLIDSSGKVIEHENDSSFPSHNFETRCLCSRNYHSKISYSLDHSCPFHVKITNVSRSPVSIMVDISGTFFKNFVLPARKSRDISELENVFSTERELVPIWELEKKISIYGDNLNLTRELDIHRKCETHVEIEPKLPLAPPLSPKVENDKKLQVELIDSDGKIIDFETWQTFTEKPSTISTSFCPENDSKVYRHEKTLPENYSKVSYTIDKNFPFSLRVTNCTANFMRILLRIRDFSLHTFDLEPKESREFKELKDTSVPWSQSIPIWQGLKDDRKIFLSADIFSDPSFMKKSRSKYASAEWQGPQPEKYGVVVEIN